MAPQKTGSKSKAKKDKPAVTLHQFFASPSAGSSKKPALKSAAESSTKRTPKPAQKRKSAPPNPQDIIVIDSDSDVEVEAIRTPQKKRRRSESSDVEVLPSAPIKRVNTSLSAPVAFPKTTLSFGKPSSLLAEKAEGSEICPEPNPPSLSFGDASPVLGGPNPVTLAATSSFGKPSSVLKDRPISLDTDCDLTPAIEDVPRSVFGKPSSLLQTPSVSLTEDCPSPAAMDNVPAGVEDEDEWGMGDDEIGANLEEDEDDDCTVVDEPEPAVDFLCPLCRKTLSESSPAERESHVNACLDASSGGPHAGSSKAPLKPLSSLPVPNLFARPSRNGSNAFSVLMSSRSEMAIWNEATEAENSRGTKKVRRKAPFYKVMQGMPIAVDAFRYGCIPGVTAYFLTHAHSDHYTNLTASWQHGPIYCSEGTANLIIHILSVDRKWVHPLPMDVPTVIPNTGGVHVTLIEANHCPGSCLFLFEGRQTVDAGDSSYKSPYIGSPKTFRYLHCGDFRASPQHTLHPAVKGKHIDQVYLDTTYLDPKYTFPPQPLVISACAEFAKRMIDGRSTGPPAPKVDAWLATSSSDSKGKQKAHSERILIVVGTYSVGKERIVKAVAQAVKSKIYCDARKAAILRCQQDPELHALLTSDPLSADVHILPLGMISFEKLQHYLQRFKGKFTKVVGFRPTGWTFRPPTGASQSPTIPSVIAITQQKSFTYANLHPARSTNSALELIPVPYSEHSSFFELTCFALSIDWGRMIATVNVGSERSRARMARWMEKWQAERKKRKKGEAVPHRRPDYW
ncbi:DNA cross-link repair protein PSO2/SNM1 [Favolaschia claudopus]|uniref:DNA cross-link repair protein PSO2/SNM1 n=1 Tax=Favolaschia claudopus TaxID=2862362 RepID=A0AAW0BGW9_9AGAR